MGGVFSHAVAVIRQSEVRKNPYLVNVSYSAELCLSMVFFMKFRAIVMYRQEVFADSRQSPISVYSDHENIRRSHHRRYLVLL